MFLEGNTSILLVRKSIDDKCFVNVITVQLTVFVGNHTNFFSLDLSCRTNVAEICRSLVGNGQYTQEHARFYCILKQISKTLYVNGSSACLISCNN